MASEEAGAEQEQEGQEQEFDDSFGGRLRQLRHWYGMSQQTLSELSRVSRRVLSEYEQGIRYPAVEDEILLARALRVRTEYLLFGEKPPTEEEIAAQRLQFRLERVSEPEAQTAIRMIDGIQHSLLIQALRRNGQS